MKNKIKIICKNCGSKETNTDKDGSWCFYCGNVILNNGKQFVSSYFKYKNPSKNCIYPWSPCAMGYCCSYANHVDKTKNYENMAKICEGCEVYK